MGTRAIVCGVGASIIAMMIACGSSSSSGGGFEGTGEDGASPFLPDSGAQNAGDGNVASDGSAGEQDGASANDAGTTDSLTSNRDRLLATYLAYLKSTPAVTQSNGLSGANVSTVCDIWTKLDPSSRDTYLTITARLQGSIVSKDGDSMLAHITKLYRLTGGQNATKSDPGSCGGGEYNRMIMSMNMQLHESLVAANTNKGAVNGTGEYDIADIPTNSNHFWRDSHDLGGPHAPFDLSDETDPGAPRGQVQYFKDPTSTLANTALGRQDLTTLVDPYAIEMDEDFDCPHNSNPSCDYTTYGPLCAPEADLLGTAIWTQNYGNYDPGYLPAGCTLPDGG